MNILGIGIDIVETGRIESSITRFGDAFLQRVFTISEIAYCASMKNATPCYAARFAAKEAVAKAFGTGLGGRIGWQEIEVRRKASGAPFIVLHGAAHDFSKSLAVSEIMISLSHSEHYAVANALLIGANDAR